MKAADFQNQRLPPKRVVKKKSGRPTRPDRPKPSKEERKAAERLATATSRVEAAQPDEKARTPNSNPLRTVLLTRGLLDSVKDELLREVQEARALLENLQVQLQLPWVSHGINTLSPPRFLTGCGQKGEGRGP